MLSAARIQSGVILDPATTRAVTAGVLDPISESSRPAPVMSATRSAPFAGPGRQPSPLRLALT